MKKIILFICIALLLGGVLPVLAIGPPLSLDAPDANRKAKTVKLWWYEVYDADYYKVQLRTKKNKKVKSFKHVNNTYKNVKKKYLTSNKAYKFRVRSCNADEGCSKFSDWDNFRTLPAKVKNVRATEILSDCVTVKWKKVRGKRTYYQVNLYSNSGVLYGSQDSGQNDNEREYCGLDSKTKYKIRVKAIYGVNGGKLSKALSFTTR